MGSMGITKPTPGGSTDTWGQDLNDDVIDVLEEHDHTAGNGVRVPAAGLDIDAALSFASNNATNLGAAGLAAVAAASAPNASLYRSSSDNELYWKTSGGTSVQLTNGASLNTALIGGITGDYATTDADVEYVDADKTYEIKQDEGPDHWAKIKVGDIHLLEPTSGITNAVRLKSPTSLAAGYDWTFPAALPAVTKLLTLSSAGAVGSLSSPATVGFVKSATTGAASNELTRTVYLTLANAYTTDDWAQDKTSSNGSMWATTSTGSETLTVPLDGLPIGWRIKSVSALVKDHATNPRTVALNIQTRLYPGAASSPAQSGGPSSGAGTVQTVTRTLTTPETVVAGTLYWLNITAASGATGNPEAYQVAVELDYGT